MYRINEFVKLIGVSNQTLIRYRWDQSSKLKAIHLMVVEAIINENMQI